VVWVYLGEDFSGAIHGRESKTPEHAATDQLPDGEHPVPSLAQCRAWRFLPAVYLPVLVLVLYHERTSPLHLTLLVQGLGLRVLAGEHLA